MRGGAVCRVHGGAAPQVVAAARRRLAATDALVRYEVTADWIVQRLAAIADGTIAESGVILPDGSYEVDLTTLTHQQSRAIQEIIVDQTGGGGDGERKAVERVRVRLRDATKALEILARWQRMLTDRVEIDGTDELLAALAAGRRRVSGQVIDATSEPLPDTVTLPPAQASMGPGSRDPGNGIESGTVTLPPAQ